MNDTSSDVFIEVVQPDTDATDYMPVIIDGLNGAYKERGDLGNLDAMEASFGTVCGEVARSIGATGIRFPNDTTVVFCFGGAR